MVGTFISNGITVKYKMNENMLQDVLIPDKSTLFIFWNDNVKGFTLTCLFL